MALRELSLISSVVNCTRTQLSFSKAKHSIRNLASVLTKVRCHDAESQVHPISSFLCCRSIFQKRVEPMTRLGSRISVTKGMTVPAT